MVVQPAVLGRRSARRRQRRQVLQGAGVAAQVALQLGCQASPKLRVVHVRVAPVRREMISISLGVSEVGPGGQMVAARLAPSTV